MNMAVKSYTVEEKYNIIFESLSTNQSISEICRKYAISPSTFQIWKDQFLTGARSGRYLINGFSEYRESYMERFQYELFLRS